jgi:hypothetical protein
MTTISQVVSASYFGARRISEWGVSLEALSAADRRLAERWIAQAGTAAFVRIMRGVAASKKNRGPKPLEGEHMLVEAARLVQNKGMEPHAAATIVARRVVEESDWRGRRRSGVTALSTWIYRHLRLRLPEMQRRETRAAAGWRATGRPAS